MALTLLPPTPIHRLSHCMRAPTPHNSNLTRTNTSFSSPSLSTSSSCFQRAHATDKDAEISSNKSDIGFLDADLLRRVSRAKDANQVLDAIEEVKRSNDARNVLDIQDCNAIITAAFDSGNVELALSVFEAMRSGFVRDGLDGDVMVGRWRWAMPDLQTYALLVQRLAAVLRVSDAIRIIDYVSRVGVSLGEEEVTFGKIVRCPTCMIAIAVAQPQHGMQVVSCSKCRYQYELFSGDITSIESEEISMEFSAWEKAKRLVMKDDLPAALHSVVIRTPSGTARTHRFATRTVELPAQKGERVTISLAAPSNVYREMGPFKLGAHSPRFRPGEPMCLTNHINGQVSPLLRAPNKNGGSFFLSPYILFPSLAVLASGDAASAFIDPTLPKLISVTVLTSAAVGAALDQVILPEFRKLPQSRVDVIALKQQLLSQYDLLQTRVKDLRKLAEKEVWMLARMCQLENKIVALGEPSYRARRGRVQRVRESLESALLARIELIESYAKICSMIEIEVEMDSDVLVAEAASSAERISEQIQQIMEIDTLEEQWRIQAEANDEAERLLSSEAFFTESV